MGVESVVVLLLCLALLFVLIISCVVLIEVFSFHEDIFKIVYDFLEQDV